MLSQDFDVTTIWVSGSSVKTNNGNWGSKGIPSSSNRISSRVFSTAWVDSNNTFWVFGGLDGGVNGGIITMRTKHDQCGTIYGNSTESTGLGSLDPIQAIN